jgi:hypothetical protein
MKEELNDSLNYFMQAKGNDNNEDESLTSIQVDNFIDKKLNIVNNSFGNIKEELQKKMSFKDIINDEPKESVQKKMSFKDILNDESTDFNKVEFKLKESDINEDSPIILEPIVT